MNIPTLPLTLLAPLVAWTGQVLVLVAAGAAAALAIANPKARLRLWQGLLLVLLLLPVIEPWRSPAQLAALEQTASSEIVTTQAAPVSSSFHWRPEYWIWLIAAGAVVRLIWLAAGFARLRRYRQHARPLPEPLRFASDGATWYASESVPGPVTYGGFFGWTRPVILLPARVLELPADLREAIECHELIHVRRGDWMFVLGEALVRSLFWFHPAIWFVLGRIQLAREQVVDQEAIRLLQNRDAYLDALVAVAEYSLQPDLAPAPLFLRKRHLAERVNAVLKEIKMTRSRMVAGITAVCCALPVAAFAAMWLFPFVSQAQTSPDSPGIAVEAGAVLLHRAPVHAPEGSTIAGTVVIQATIDTKGEVSDAHVLSGPDELRKEVLSSVLQWHYRPGPTLAQISIQFSGAVASATAPPAAPSVRLATAKQAPVIQQGSDGTLKSIEFTGISAEAEQELRSRLNVREGDTLNRQDTSNILATVKAYDSHLNAMFTIAANGGITRLRIAPGGGARGSSAPTFTTTAAGSTATSAAIPPATAAAAAVGAYPAGNGVSSPIPTYKVDPQYTEEARAAKWQGSVLLSTVIDENGVPQNIQVVRPLGLGLDQKAIEAVSQWRFNPGLKDGAAVKVQAQIEVTFRLL